MSEPEPPRLAVALLRRASPRDDRDSLLADLEQEFIERSRAAADARRWYWRQTLGSLLPLARRRIELAFPSRERRLSMGPRSGIPTGVVDDLRYTWRLARRTPTVTLAIVIAVTLGIAATTAIVSVMEGVFLRPLPFPAAERLVQLGTSIQGFGQAPEVNFLDANDWGRRSSTLAALASYSVDPAAVRLAPGLPTFSASVLSTGAGLDAVLGLHVSPGRWFAPEEQVFGGPGVVLLSHRFWRAHFAGDPSAVGRRIEIGGNTSTVIGVLPAAADRFPTGGADLWVPLTFSTDSFLNQRGSIALSLVGRLRPGASIAMARNDLTAIAAELGRQYPNTNSRRGATIENLQDAMVGPIRPMMLLLAGAIVLLLAVTCSNIANLLLAHAHSRAREFGIRAAIGATRARLLRQLWTENVALFAVSGTMGVALAAPLARAVVAWYPGDLPLTGDIQLDGRVLVAAGLVTMCAMLLAGVPQARRLRASSVGSGMGDGDRGGISRGHRRVASAFVVAQVAISMVLLVGGLLLLRTFTNLTSIDPGFQSSGIVTMRAALPATASNSAAAMIAFQDRLRDVAATLPGVDAAAHAMFLPFTPGTWGDTYRRAGEPASPAAGPLAHFYMVSPEYLSLMGVPILRGRGLASTDAATAPRVLVVSQAFASRAFPDGNALGQRLAWNDDQWEIVGIARDVRHTSFWEPPDADAYVPRSQVIRWPTWLVLKTQQPATAIATALYDRMKAEAPGLAITDAGTMSARLSETMAPERFRALVTGTIAALSLLLAVIGLYGVVAYAVTRRTREIGVRIALGARASTVCGRILGETGRTVAIGLIPGIAGSLVLARWLASEGVVQASVTGTILTTIAIFFAAAFLAAIVPAIRASRVDPVVALRQE